jgi:hypothetical protein
MKKKRNRTIIKEGKIRCFKNKEKWAKNAKNVMGKNVKKKVQEKIIIRGKIRVGKILRKSNSEKMGIFLKD